MLFKNEYLSMIEYGAVTSQSSELNPIWPRGLTVSRAVPPRHAGDLCIPLLDADGKQVLCKVTPQNTIDYRFSRNPGLLADTADSYTTPTSFTYFEVHTLTDTVDSSNWDMLASDELTFNYCSEWLRWGFRLSGLCVISTDTISYDGGVVSASDGIVLVPNYSSVADTNITVILGTKAFSFTSVSDIRTNAEAAGILCQESYTGNIIDTYYHDYRAKALQEYYRSGLDVSPLSSITFHIGVLGGILRGPHVGSFVYPYASCVSAVGAFKSV